MKVNKISKNLIKPQTPTPQNLKNYNISFLDQLMEPMILSVILFYESKPEDYERQLEESLAKTLVQFYPLAGRYIKNDHIVDCTDHGAEFVEAEALDVELLDLIANNEAEQLNALLPDLHFRPHHEGADDPLLSIQATRFTCGGAAVAVSITHRVFDVSSLETFIAVWSNTSNLDKKVEFIVPTFNIPSLLPYLDLNLGLDSDKKFIGEIEKMCVKRLLFNKEALMSLKSKIRVNNNGRTISGVRVVCAVIAKALIRADRGDFLLLQGINMRERTIPSQPKRACGNFAFPSHARRVAAGEIGIQELVDVIGDGVRKSISDYAEIMSPDRDIRRVIVNNLGNMSKQIRIPQTNVLGFSDWSKFGFYEADFGWGKPVWTGIRVDRPCVNFVVLMRDKEGDGIEAWVHLNQEYMCHFEQNEEIKFFTT